MKIFNELILLKDKVILDGKEYDVVKGKHELWIPELEIKVIWAFNGRVYSNTDWQLGVHRNIIPEQLFNDELDPFGRNYSRQSLANIANEYILMTQLSKAGMAPPVGELFFIKNVVSNVVYSEQHCDSRGAYGYYLKDANRLPTGKFNFEDFKKTFLDTNLIGSPPRPLNDLCKSVNVINGYAIDVRRTFWDMMRWQGSGLKAVEKQLDIKESLTEIKKKILKLSQFPDKQRKQNYQSYWLLNHYESGARDTLYRMDKLGVDQWLKGFTVVDLGCQLGAVALECYRRGARKVTGIDSVSNYIDCARDLARINNFQVNFLVKDLTEPKHIISYLNAYYKKPIDIVFALSLYKHIGDKIFDVLQYTNWEICFFESNNSPEGRDSAHAQKIEKGFQRLNCRIDYLGITEDRNSRAIWRLER